MPTKFARCAFNWKSCCVRDEHRHVSTSMDVCVLSRCKHHTHLILLTPCSNHHQTGSVDSVPQGLCLALWHLYEGHMAHIGKAPFHAQQVHNYAHTVHAALKLRSAWEAPIVLSNLLANSSTGLHVEEDNVL